MFDTAAVQCPRLTLNSGIIRFTDENFFRSVASHECNPDYDLVGSKVRVCLANRTWSGEPASCVRKYTAYKYRPTKNVILDINKFSIVSSSPGLILILRDLEIDLLAFPSVNNVFKNTKLL